jgi:hypothetical protein
MTKQTIAQIHPVAELFPLLNDAELAELAESIKQTGLLTPIVCDPHDVLLDGRNRLKACEMAGIEPRFEIYDGDPVEFILAANIARRHLTAGQCAVIVALAYPEPEKGGRGKSTNVSKLERFSASRLSEARTIVKYSRDLAKEVIDGLCTFQQALWEATATSITHADPQPHGTPTIVHHLNPTKLSNEMRAAMHRGEIDNERRRELLAAHFAKQRAAAQAEPDATAPGRTKEDPVEQWLFDWEPDGLADRVIAADRIKPGYAQKVVDAILEKMGTRPMRH